MTDRLCQAAVLGVLVLGAGGCGGSSSSHSATGAAPASAPTSATSSPAATTTSTPPKRSKQPTRAATTTSPVPTTPATVATAPPPTPSGTPAAPDGLTQTNGYATYELCSAHCSGAVPASLRRPLNLPHLAAGGACPVSRASRPVKPLDSGQLAISPFIGSAWKAGRVTWVAAPSYAGPVLIRGRELGGAQAVGFGEGRIPYDELQLLVAGMQAPAHPGDGRAWLSYTRVRGPGCYAYQVDGTSFSSVIVFRTVG